MHVHVCVCLTLYPHHSSHSPAHHICYTCHYEQDKQDMQRKMMFIWLVVKVQPNTLQSCDKTSVGAFIVHEDMKYII